MKRIKFIISIMLLIIGSVSLSYASKINNISDLIDFIQEDNQVFNIEKTKQFNGSESEYRDWLERHRGNDGGGSGGGGIAGGVIPLDQQILLPGALEQVNMMSKGASETADMTLFDDELIYRYSLSNVNKNQNDANKVILNVSGINHTSKCKEKTDSAYVIVNINDLTNYSEFSNFKFVKDENTTKDGILSSGQNQIFIDKFNKWYHGYRNTEADKRVLYLNKNSASVVQEIKSIISNITEGIKPLEDKVGNSQTLSRINRSIKPELQFTYTCGDCGASGEVSIVNEASIKLNQSGEFILNHEWGTINNGHTIPEKNGKVVEISVWNKTFGKGYNVNSKNVFVAGKPIEFYPFVGMRYATVDNDEYKRAYVVSTNKSSLVSPITVNIRSEELKEPTIKMDTQWTTESSGLKVLQDNNINDKEALTKGGSLISLSSYNENININIPKTNFLIDSYITCVPTSLAPYFQSVSYTESQAMNELARFKLSLKNTLNNYYIEKWVSPGIKKNEIDFNQTALCVDGFNSQTQFQGTTLNKVDKYYFNTNGTQNNPKINIDIQNELIDIFTIKVDEYGNFNLYKNNKLGSTIPKSQLVTNFTGNNFAMFDTEWQEIEANSNIISNLILGLDRNLGKSGRYGGYTGWYNEGIDGISIVRQRLNVNLYMPKQIINTQDPALCGLSNSSYDKYPNSDLDNTWRTLQYKLSKRSLTNVASQDNVIGILAGNEVVFPGIEYILKSKLFYLSNVTVEQ